MPGAALRGYGRAYMNGGGSPAWTRKEGKSESGGLNKKGRASYKAGEIVGKQKNLPPFLKKKILNAKKG